MRWFILALIALTITGVTAEVRVPKDDRCITVETKQLPDGTYEGHAVCGPAPCTPDERLGAHETCPDKGGHAIGPWEYEFRLNGTRWRALGTATWHEWKSD
jgi:hypothetical protein